MNPSVHNQRILPGKFLATIFALKALFSCMKRGNMVLQIAPLSEPPSAMFTTIGLVA